MNEQTQQPLVRLGLYEQAVILTRFQEKGTASYPVSVDDLAAALADVPVSSGFLPANTLFWQRRKGESQIGIYVPGRQWTVLIGERQLTIPMPPLIFTGRGTRYAVYAIKRRPRDVHCRLYHAPCPNVHVWRYLPGQRALPNLYAGDHHAIPQPVPREQQLLRRSGSG